MLIHEFNEIAKNAQKKAFITIGIEIQKDEVQTLTQHQEKYKKLRLKCAGKNFENDANLLYCIENSFVTIRHELQMLINIKEDNMDEAWANLVNAQVIYGTVVRNSPIELITANGYLERLASYERLLFPVLYFQSMGGIIKKSTCSICGQNFNKCVHIRGRLYNGELCYREIVEFELEEVSLVETPANKHARALTIQHNGKNVDVMTLREKPQIEKSDNDENT